MYSLPVSLPQYRKLKAGPIHGQSSTSILFFLHSSMFSWMKSFLETQETLISSVCSHKCTSAETVPQQQHAASTDQKPFYKRSRGAVRTLRSASRRHPLILSKCPLLHVKKTTVHRRELESRPNWCSLYLQMTLISLTYKILMQLTQLHREQWGWRECEETEKEKQTQ